MRAECFGGGPLDGRVFDQPMLATNVARPEPAAGANQYHLYELHPAPFLHYCYLGVVRMRDDREEWQR